MQERFRNLRHEEFVTIVNEICERLNIDGYSPIYPWETEEDQINHPDDKEENIFF